MNPFIEQLAIYRQRVDTALQHYFDALPEEASALSEVMRYGALLGGKRLRPYLVYATGEMLGLPLSSLDPAAAAIECIHAYSLIHDDLPAMDDDPIRRGQATCHIRFGEANAILAGDALQTFAFSILCDQEMQGVEVHHRLSMLSELAIASGAGGMCTGQYLDLEAEGKCVTLPELERIHRYKTGALIRVSVRLAALAAGEQGQRILPILDRYADAVGLAFQVQDDILDVVGETEKIGKQQGSDQILGKSTYPALLGLENARKKAHSLCLEARSALAELTQQAYDVTALEQLATFIVERDN